MYHIYFNIGVYVYIYICIYIYTLYITFGNQTDVQGRHMWPRARRPAEILGFSEIEGGCLTNKTKIVFDILGLFMDWVLDIPNHFIMDGSG